jgi:hypothetical protein
MDRVDSAAQGSVYTPSKPGYRIADLDDAIDFAACQRDRIPCAGCGELVDRHGFDTYCRGPRRTDLGLSPH